MSIGNGFLRLLLLFPHMNARLRYCSTSAFPDTSPATWMKYKLLSYRQGVFPSTDTHGSVALYDIQLQIIKLLVRDLALVPAATFFVPEH